MTVLIYLYADPDCFVSTIHRLLHNTLLKLYESVFLWILLVKLSALVFALLCFVSSLTIYCLKVRRPDLHSKLLYRASFCCFWVLSAAFLRVLNVCWLLWLAALYFSSNSKECQLRFPELCLSVQVLALWRLHWLIFLKITYLYMLLLAHLLLFYLLSQLNLFSDFFELGSQKQEAAF